MAENDSQTPPTIQPPPPTQTPPGNLPPSPGSSESEARTWNMLCHLSALAGVVVPLGNIIGPLVVWQIKKNQIPSVEAHGKAALNYQITVVIALAAISMVLFTACFFCLGFLLVPVAIPLIVLISLASLIFPIIAGIKANNGETFDYPFTFTFIR